MSVRRDEIQLDVLINGNKAGTTMDDLTKKVRILELEKKKLAIGSDAFIAKEAELKAANDQLATLRARTRGVDLAMKDAGKSTNAFADFLKNRLAPAVIIAFVAQKVSQFFRAIVDGLKTLDATERKFKAVFGAAGSIVTSFARTNAQAMGVTRKEFEALASQIGDILIPMGFQREAAARMSAELTQLSGKLSEWSAGQRTAEEVAHIITRALTGERESLKSLGVVLKEADITARLAAKGQKELTGSALEQAKAIATLELIQERSADAQTAFAVNSDSLQRSNSRISNTFKELGESIGSAFLPFIRSATKAWADLVSPIDTASEALQQELTLYKVQIETLKRGDLSIEGRKKLVEELNVTNQAHNATLLTTESTLEDIEAANDKVTASLTRQIRVLALKEQAQQIANREAQLQLKLLDQELRETELINEAASTPQIANNRESINNRVATIQREQIENKAAQEATRAEIAETAQEYNKLGIVAERLGVALTDLLKTETPKATPTGVPTEDQLKKAFKAQEDLIIQEREARINALRFLALTQEEFDAQREVIVLEAENRIAQKKIEILKLTAGEEAVLRNEIADNEVKILEIKAEQDLALRRSFIAIEEADKIKSLDALQLQEEKHAEALKIIKLQTALDLAKIDADNTALSTEERLKAANDVAEAEKALKKATDDASLNTTIETIEKARLLALAGVEDMKLAEEDLQTARKLINLEADIKIIEERLRTYEAGTEAALKLEEELARKRAELNSTGFKVTGPDGQTSSDDDIRQKLISEQEFREKAEALALGAAAKFISQKADLERQAIDDELALRLAAIDKEYASKLKAAQGNAKLEQQIQREIDGKKREAERVAARAKKGIARKEAVIQGALSFIEAVPDPFLMALAAGATLVNLALIDSQTFYKGGYTPKASGKGIKDRQGREIVGGVHADEWIANPKTTKHPILGPIIRDLDVIQRRNFYDGGYTSPVDTTPVGVVGLDLTGKSGQSSSDLLEEFRALRRENRELKDAIQNMPLRIKAYLVHSELEDFQEEIDEVRRRSVI